LVQFLSAVVADDTNSRCVTWAIHKLGSEHYEPAISILTKLLDFHRPPTEREKLGFTNVGGIAGIWDLYPAVGALELLGKNVLPEVLRAIQAASTSPTARENAVFVWMEIYRYNDEQPKAVALLKQEEMNVKDDATKQRLAWAVQKAVARCNPADIDACREAAAGRASGH
jgi:hypothetical protein